MTFIVATGDVWRVRRKGIKSVERAKDRIGCKSMNKKGKSYFDSSDVSLLTSPRDG